MNLVVDGSSSGSLQSSGVYHCVWICWSGSWLEMLCDALCMLGRAAGLSWCYFSLCCPGKFSDHLWSEHCPFNRGQNVDCRVCSITKKQRALCHSNFLNLPKFQFIFSFLPPRVLCFYLSYSSYSMELRPVFTESGPACLISLVGAAVTGLINQKGPGSSKSLGALWKTVQSKILWLGGK